MNKLWNTRMYSPQKLHRTIDRQGICIHIHPQVHPFIRRELLLFCKWLRSCYQFPIRVHVHIPNAKKVLSRDGELCYGICFVPYDPNDSISIYVAGGYKDTGNSKHLKNYTWTTIGTLAHELGHYYQHINQLKLTSRGTEWQATYYANRILSEYYNAGFDHFADDWIKIESDS